jgi:hypothetical protein
MRHHLAMFRSIAFFSVFFAFFVAQAGEVYAANRAPVISGTPPTSATVGKAYVFQPTATDANRDTLRFSISNKPIWANFDSRTGRLSGTPSSINVKTYSNIVISVSDGRALARLAPFGIVVSSAVANRAPVISGTPATTVNAGSAYSFQPTASDANGDTLSFNIINKPSWATFSTSTGRLSGTPTASNVGSYANITISVTDSKVTSMLPTFNITVVAAVAANSAPVISGVPATTVTVGSAYTFQPAAQDANGDTLTFSISNKPSWATFSTSTGLLSGTPTVAGSYTNIVISVSDGKASTNLAAFAITTVSAAASTNTTTTTTSSAVLSWVAPPTRTDGSALSLSEIAGYRVYRGTSASNLVLLKDLNDGSLTGYTATNLAAATTYYFAVKVYDYSGNESGYSTVVSKKMP